MASLLVALFVTGCARSDADVQAELQRQLVSDSETAAITASVGDGVARLSGVITRQTQQQRAMDIARAVKGVREVESRIRMDDAALTEAVKKAIAADGAVNAVPLTIDVSDGEVRLSSNATNADQRARLTEVVRAVPGVTHVEDQMK